MGHLEAHPGGPFGGPSPGSSCWAIGGPTGGPLAGHQGMITCTNAFVQDKFVQELEQ